MPVSFHDAIERYPIKPLRRWDVPHLSLVDASRDWHSPIGNQLVKLAGGNAYIGRRLNSRETASGEGTVPLSGHRAISTPAISPKNPSKVSNPSKGKEYNDLAAWTGLAQGVHPVQISCRL